jgi:hypothetical protein
MTIARFASASGTRNLRASIPTNPTPESSTLLEQEPDGALAVWGEGG